MKRHHKDTGGLASELASLPALGRHALAEQWRELYRTELPARIGSGFLISAIACRLQEQALGGLKPATIRYLINVATEISSGSESSGNKISAPPTVVKSGTRLLREWRGVTYEVLVLEKGVRCNGNHYRSLSEVAHHITGSKWSGPLFFGLKKKRVV